MAVLCDAALYNLVENGRRFGGAYRPESQKTRVYLQDILNGKKN